MRAFFAALFQPTRAPNTGPGNAELNAYRRSQLPPLVDIRGPGRMVMGTIAPLEGSFILLGNGAVQSAVVSSSLGIHYTPEMSGLTDRQSLL